MLEIPEAIFDKDRAQQSRWFCFCPKLSFVRFLALAFVPVELCLQIGLGILDSWEYAQRSLEFLTTRGAGSDTWH